MVLHHLAAVVCLHMALKVLHLAISTTIYTCICALPPVDSHHQRPVVEITDPHRSHSIEGGTGVVLMGNMRRPVGGELCCMVLVVVVACLAAASPVSAASDDAVGADNTVHLEDLPVEELFSPESPFYHPIFVGATPRQAKCWRSLLGVESCVTGMFASILRGQIRLSSGCCRTISGLGAYCFPRIFAFPVLGSVVRNLIKESCDELLPQSPPH
ncbi:hypothetical protein Taro_036624 [Colocasia esculenta]|uniref:Prolamin-like domain-containing protein n=1 Tax=Colocasia esculenta TaxID=4460 RepID=A0A843VY20_COLES|nr:hypothetical protein [Colocasia esculenta]